MPVNNHSGDAHYNIATVIMYLCAISRDARAIKKIADEHTDCRR